MSEIIAVLLFICGCALGAFAVRRFATRDVVPRADLDEAKVQNQVLTAKMEALQERVQQQQADEARTNEKFENLATKIFDAQADKFTKNSKEKLDVLLNPLQTQLKSFQEKVDQHVKEQFSLKDQIANIVALNSRMSQETINLTNALKGQSKTQGDWGELVLENILEASGLRRDDDYVLQGTDLGLKDENGRVQKPDVVVKLPERKHIIIDSKVSLTHYEAYFSAEEAGGKASALRNYLASVRSHVIGLQVRGYQHNEKLGTPDFVLMFVPTEGAYALAIQEDKELHNFAWDKRIVIVCPSTLFATLRTVASIWRLELQNRNAIDIAKRGGALYDKFASFVEDMKRVGKQIEATDKAYGEAMNKLSDGKGNILWQVENLKQLGAKATKNLPIGLIETDESVEAEVIDIADKIQAN
jgi:DNA recombination protein RmuC